MSHQNGQSDNSPKKEQEDGQPEWEPTTSDDLSRAETPDASQQPETGEAEAATRLDEVIRDAARSGAKAEARAKTAPGSTGEYDSPTAAQGEGEDDAAGNPGAPGNDTGTEAGDEDTAALAEQVAELKERLARTEAERRNERRRLEKEKADAQAYGMANFARELLSVGDYLRMALDSMPEDLKADSRFKTFYQGVEMTEKEFHSALQANNITRIDPKGDPFDPNLHQAMTEVETTDFAPGTVAQVMKPGYMIKDRLLRAAMVAVAKAPKDDGDGVDQTA